MGKKRPEAETCEITELPGLGVAGNALHATKTGRRTTYLQSFWQANKGVPFLKGLNIFLGPLLLFPLNSNG